MSRTIIPIRNKVTSLRITDDEYRKMSNLASTLNMSFGKFARFSMSVVSREVAQDPQAIAEIRQRYSI